MTEKIHTMTTDDKKYNIVVIDAMTIEVDINAVKIRGEDKLDLSQNITAWRSGDIKTLVTEWIEALIDKEIDISEAILSASKNFKIADTEADAIWIDYITSE